MARSDAILLTASDRAPVALLVTLTPLLHSITMTTQRSAASVESHRHRVTMFGRSLHRETRARPGPLDPRGPRAPQGREDPPVTQARTGPEAWPV